MFYKQRIPEPRAYISLYLVFAIAEELVILVSNIVIIDYFRTRSRTQKERASKICKSCNDVSVQVLNKDDRLDVL